MVSNLVLTIQKVNRFLNGTQGWTIYCFIYKRNSFFLYKQSRLVLAFDGYGNHLVFNHSKPGLDFSAKLDRFIQKKNPL
jgi:hypothetical protein